MGESVRTTNTANKDLQGLMSRILESQSGQMTLHSGVCYCILLTELITISRMERGFGQTHFGARPSSPMLLFPCLSVSVDYLFIKVCYFYWFSTLASVFFCKLLHSQWIWFPWSAVDHILLPVVFPHSLDPSSTWLSIWVGCLVVVSCWSPHHLFAAPICCCLYAISIVSAGGLCFWH